MSPKPPVTTVVKLHQILWARLLTDGSFSPSKYCMINAPAKIARMSPRIDFFINLMSSTSLSLSIPRQKKNRMRKALPSLNSLIILTRRRTRPYLTTAAFSSRARGGMGMEVTKSIQ